METVLAFLRQLSENNDRDWMAVHKKEFEEAKQVFNVLVDELIQGICQFDGTLAGQKARDCVFRLHRDTRFSHDKRPYKTNFGAAMAEGGRKSGNPLYYIHIEPGKSFVAGGVYMPDADRLAKIRQEIDYNAEGLIQVVGAPGFQEHFGRLSGESLKRAPKGYPADHPHVEWLKMKSYLVSSPVDDADFRQETFTRDLLKRFRMMYPLKQYLTTAIS